MKMRGRVLLLSSILLLSAGALAWWQGWFASEPVYHGRTVTQWLDAMAIYDEVRNRDQSEMESISHVPAPEKIVADPALQALLTLGPRAVPALRSHVVEPLKPRPWRQRLAHWLRETWLRFRDSKYPAYTPLPLYHSSRDEARSLAAGLALLVLGTNRDAGMPVLIKELAEARRVTYEGPQHISAYWSIDTALIGFPQLRSEMRDAIDQALTNADPLYRQVAVRNALIRRFPEDFPRWHPLLIRLAGTEREDSKVRDGAMFALLVRPPTGDPDFVALCAQILTNGNNASLLRGRATGGLRFGGSTNAHFFSLVKAATRDSDGLVQQSARTALKNLEHSPK